MTPQVGTGTTKRATARRVLPGLVLLVVLCGMVGADPGDEYRTRQSDLDKRTAEEFYELGLWCVEQKLFSEAREQFERVLLLVPGHPEATQKLVQLTPVIKRVKSLPCELRLVNGDLVQAELLMASFKMQTSSGFLLIPTGDIDLIQLGSGPKPDHVISDAYTGTGRIEAEQILATGKVGDISVKRQEIASIRVLRPCETCKGKGAIKCRRCSGLGRLNEKSVCPDCEGKGWLACKTCNGTGKVTCPLCGGRGRFVGAWGRLRRVVCPRCAGEGTVNCTDCKNGRIECPTCKGKPVSHQAGECPVCKGKKEVPCQACGGTGARPLPKTEPEEEKPVAPETIPKPPEEIENP